jgi:hypothetical protein
MSLAADFSDPTPATPRDMTSMVEVLEGRHGQHAAGVAEFFSTMHGTNGDAGRAWAWAGVAAMVRQREKVRVAQQ